MWIAFLRMQFRQNRDLIWNLAILKKTSIDTSKLKKLTVLQCCIQESKFFNSKTNVWYYMKLTARMLNIKQDLYCFKNSTIFESYSSDSLAKDSSSKNIVWKSILNASARGLSEQPLFKTPPSSYNHVERNCGAR